MEAMDRARIFMPTPIGCPVKPLVLAIRILSVLSPRSFEAL